jgi:hypothetical protein
MSAGKLVTAFKVGLGTGTLINDTFHTDKIISDRLTRHFGPASSETIQRFDRPFKVMSDIVRRVGI